MPTPHIAKQRQPHIGQLDMFAVALPPEPQSPIFETEKEQIADTQVKKSSQLVVLHSAKPATTPPSFPTLEPQQTPAPSQKPATKNKPSKAKHPFAVMVEQHIHSLDGDGDGDGERDTKKPDEGEEIDAHEVDSCKIMRDIAASISPDKLLDPFDEFGGGSDRANVDVFTIVPEDTFTQRMAKAMFSRMLYDLAGIEPTSADVLEDVGLDLFGQVSIKTTKQHYGTLRKYDALIWIFNLNTDEPLISFDWVCDELRFDAERIRRVVARSVKKDLRQMLRFLDGFTDQEHVQTCQSQMSEYVDLDSWRTVSKPH